MPTTSATDLKPPPSRAFRQKGGLALLVGPGLIVAATGVGAGDLTAATAAGANFGLVLIWAVAVGAAFKFVLNEGLARWQLATGRTLVEGWSDHLPGWVQAYFAVYLVVWTVSVSAALANACGLGIANLTGGAIPTSWGSVLHSLAGGLLVWAGGFRGFEKLMRILVAIMFAGIVVSSILTFQDAAGVAGGLFVPQAPAGGTASLLALVGGVGGTLTVLNYNYWMREESIAGPGALRYVRIDLCIAYAATAVFAIAVLIMANHAFFVPDIALTNETAVSQMAEMLTGSLGPAWGLLYSFGFWGAVFSSLLGVWQGVPYMYADMYGVLKKQPAEARAALTDVTSKPYRMALAAITLVPIPFAFLDQPLPVVLTYTVVGSLFIPFLAATLLYLNNRVRWTSAVRKNGWIANLMLVLILLFYAALAAIDIARTL